LNLGHNRYGDGDLTEESAPNFKTGSGTKMAVQDPECRFGCDLHWGPIYTSFCHPISDESEGIFSRCSEHLVSIWHQIKWIIVMKLRPSPETIHALRLILDELEQNVIPADGKLAMAELKNILLLRIAELEASTAIEEAKTQRPAERVGTSTVWFADDPSQFPDA
jgi:hypothetical protein